jgi:hypothetical protein
MTARTFPSRWSTRWMLGVVAPTAFALLAACGGGGDDTPQASTAGTLADTPGTAQALAQESSRALSAAQTRNTLTLPHAPELLPLAFVLRAGQAETTACPQGGSISHDLRGSLLENVRYTVRLDQCQPRAGHVLNGSYGITYRSLLLVNLRWEAAYDIAWTQATGSTVRYSGSQRCDTLATIVSCTHVEGERSYGSSFSYTNGVINGSYAWAYEAGQTASLQFTQWGSSSGQVLITSGSSSATVVRTGADSYTVTINGGAPHTVVLPPPGP